MTTKAELTLERLQWLCRNDLKFLCKNVLQMIDWEDSLHGQLEQELKAPEDTKLILLPRNHLKSSIISVGYTIQSILNNFNIRVLLTNAVWEFSRKLLGQITGFLTNKSVLPELFGAFDGPNGRFTQDSITVAQRDSGLVKDPTITTAGLESALTGTRYDLIIHDDLVDPTNIGTMDQIKKVINFYNQSRDLVDRKTKIIVVGTRWHQSDLYGHLIENQMTSFNGKKIAPEERVRWREWLGVHNAL